MDKKPKRSRKHTFRYFVLGVIFSLIIVGAVSIALLQAQNIPITIDNLVRLHLAIPLLLVIDFFALLSVILFMWVGREKDKVVNEQRRAEMIDHDRQEALTRQQEVLVDDNNKRQAEVDALQGELTGLQAGQAEAEKNYLEQVAALQAGQAEADKNHLAEIAVLQGLLQEREKEFQDLEAVIHRGKQQWEATFDAASDLIVVTDEAGNILRCNRAAGEAFQLGFKQIIGRGIDDLLSTGDDSLLNTAPGEKSEIKSPALDGWFEVSKNHLLIDARQEGWVYILRNISAQKQALQEQQRLANYYELLVKNSPVAIATLNIEDRIVDCTPEFEKMFQYTKREALGWQAELLVSPPGQLEENKRMAAAAGNGETVRRVTQLSRKDGSLLDAEVYCIPMLAGGKQAGSLRIYHDVSELVRARKGASVAQDPAAEPEPEIDLAAMAFTAKLAEKKFFSDPARPEMTQAELESAAAGLFPEGAPPAAEEAARSALVEPSGTAAVMEAAALTAVMDEFAPVEQGAPIASADEIASAAVIEAAETAAVVETVETIAPVDEVAATEQIASDLPEAGAEVVDEAQAAGAEIGAPPAQVRRRAIPIENIEGIGPVYATRLGEFGVKTTADLLDLGKTRKGREDLVNMTGIAMALVLKWVNMADLMRVPGIGEEFSELLEKAGVDTVRELRNRDPANLFEALMKTSQTYNLVRRAPYLSEVENWVAEAKKLETVLTY